MAGGDLAGGKRTAAELSAWLCFEDESGQGLRPPVGRTWWPPWPDPGGAGDRRQPQRVSLAALIAVKPGQRPRLIYRVHTGRGHGEDRRKGFTEEEYARLLDAAHQQLGGPLGAPRVWWRLDSPQMLWSGWPLSSTVPPPGGTTV